MGWGEDGGCLGAWGKEVCWMSLNEILFWEGCDWKDIFEESLWVFTVGSCYRVLESRGQNYYTCSGQTCQQASQPSRSNYIQ